MFINYLFIINELISYDLRNLCKKLWGYGRFAYGLMEGDRIKSNYDQFTGDLLLEQLEGCTKDLQMSQDMIS